jgi:hypothetical protein
VNFLDRLRKITKSLIQNSQVRGLDWHLIPPEHKSKVLPREQTSSVSQLCKIKHIRSDCTDGYTCNAYAFLSVCVYYNSPYRNM